MRPACRTACGAFATIQHVSGRQAIPVRAVAPADVLCQTMAERMLTASKIGPAPNDH
jgi:hypothetical protein